MPSPKSTSRNVTCDFFNVALGRGGDMSFVELISQIHSQKPSASDRNIQNGDDYMRIHGWAVNGKDAQGALLRLRVQNNASVARLDSDDLRDLHLEAGEVLTEYYCFRYYAEFNVLVVHRNREAGSYGRLENYLEEMRADCKPAVLSVVPATDAWLRMDELHTMTVAEVTVKKPTSLAIFRGSGKSAQQIADLTGDVEAPYLTLKFSVGHQRGSLSTVAARNLLHELRGLGMIATATVQGKTGQYASQGYSQQDEMTLIDLVSDRLRQRVTIPIQAGRLGIGDIHQALEQAYRMRHGDLYDQFHLPT